MGLVSLHLHPASASIALLTPPKFAVYESQVHLESCRHSGKKRNQRLAMGLPRSEVAEHKRSILNDVRTKVGKRPQTGRLSVTSDSQPYTIYVISKNRAGGLAASCHCSATSKFFWPQEEECFRTEV